MVTSFGIIVLICMLVVGVSILLGVAYSSIAHAVSMNRFKHKRAKERAKRLGL